MLIDLIVTRFTAKCIAFDYAHTTTKDNVIDLSSRCELYRNLSQRTFTKNSTKASLFCDEVVLINVNKKLHDHLATENLAVVGWNLHKYYVSQLVAIVSHTTAMTKENAMDTIRKYFAVRNISEDDFALESAYKAFQRANINFIKNNKVFATTKNNVLSSNSRCLNFDYVISKLLRHFDVKQEQLISSPLSRDLSYKRKIIFFLLHRLTKVSYRTLEKRFKITYQNIYQSISRTDYYYRKAIDEKLSKDIIDAFHAVFESSPLRPLPFLALLQHDD